MTNEKLMKIAKNRVETKQLMRFQAMLFIFISILLVVIFLIANLFTEEKIFFWPIIPITGMVLAFCVQFFIFFPYMYGNSNNTKKAIQAEFQRLKQQHGGNDEK